MAEDIASLRIKVDTNEVKTASKDLNQLSQSSKSTESSVMSLNRQFVAATAAIGATLFTLKQAIDASTRYQNALNGLASVARYAGEDVGGTMNSALSLTADGMLSATEAATALKNLLSRGFSTQEATDMIMRFKDAAAFGRQASLDFGQAVVSATEGIKNENSILVDNAGVTKNVSVMWREYAQQIGKTVGELSQAEKRQAEYNGVLAETEGQLGNAEIAAAGVEGANARLTKTFNDQLVLIGQSLTPAYVGLTNKITEGFQWASDNALKPFLFYFENIGIRVGETAEKFRVFFDVLTDPKSWGSGKLTEEFAKLEKISEGMRMEAVTRLENGPSPILGEDSGKRREDSPQTDKPTSTKAVAKNRTDLMQQVLNEEERLRKEAIQDYIDSNMAQIEHDNEMTERRRQNIAEWVDSQIEGLKVVNDADEERRLRIAEMVESEKYLLEQSKNGFKELQNSIEGFSRNAAQAITDFAFGAETDFKGMVNSFLQQLARLAIQKAITDPLFNAVGDIFSSGGGIQSFFSGFFGGRAAGGNVNAGQAVVVGEAGREVFRPSAAGSITPNNKLNGSVTNNVSITISEGTRSQQGDPSELGRQLEGAVLGILLKQKRQGGLIA